MSIESKEARAREVAHDLEGTCKNLADEATEDEMKSAVFTAELDRLVFECQSCGWWCNVEEEYNEDGLCDDCCEDNTD